MAARIESLSTRQLTPCGVGSMAWRVWGGGRPLVLLHGASGSWTYWIRNILPLATRFRVFVPDMPGFGAAHGRHARRCGGFRTERPHTTTYGPRHRRLLVRWRHRRARRSAIRTSRRYPGTARTGGFGLPPVAMPPLRQIESGMTAADIERVHAENLRILMIASPRQVDDLAVFVQMENIRRARFKSGTTPASDVLAKALPAIRALSRASGRVVMRLQPRGSSGSTSIGDCSPRFSPTSTFE